MISDNYKCDGQITLFDIYPNECCGVVPWLHKTKCYMGGIEQTQQWMAYLVCPKCFKRAIDKDGWTIYSHGTIEEARQKAITIWNDPATAFDISKIDKEQGIHLSISNGDFEEWSKLYNVDMSDFDGFVARL